MKFLTSCCDSLSIKSESGGDTYAAGAALGGALRPGLLILLNGGLGTGKTRFVQGIGAALGYSRVKSPSFVIMNEYAAKVPFLHADLYRLERESEIDALGIEEYLDDGFAAAVEWAEKWRDPPGRALRVIFQTIPGDENSRVITFRATGSREAGLLREIKEKLFQTEDKR